jgi:hypothetical protein
MKAWTVFAKGPPWFHVQSSSVYRFPVTGASKAASQADPRTEAPLGAHISDNPPQLSARDCSADREPATVLVKRSSYLPPPSEGEINDCEIFTWHSSASRGAACKPSQARLGWGGPPLPLFPSGANNVACGTLSGSFPAGSTRDCEAAPKYRIETTAPN